jgi:tetratricopeptide (TPR) repeat protein
MDQLNRICNSTTLAHLPRGQELFRYVVERWLARAPKEHFKKTVIGVAVFGPSRESGVGGTAKRLRRVLDSYYQSEGWDARVLIHIPPGSYVPVIAYSPHASARLKLNDKATVYFVNALAAMDRRTLPDFDAALRLLDVALAEHPDHPRLIAVKARLHANRAMFGLRPWNELKAAEALVQRARESGFEPPDLLWAEACMRMALYWDWDGAAQLFRRGIRQTHDEIRYSAWYTALLANHGQMDEALAIRRDEVEHAPNNIACRCDLALLQIMAGRYPEAGNTLGLTLEEFPEAHYQLYMLQAILCEAQGDYAAAAAAVDRVPIKSSEIKLIMGLRPLCYGLNGDHAKARVEYDQMIAQRNGGYFPASQLAYAAIGLGDIDTAVSWLEEAVIVEHDPFLVFVNLLPFLRHLHGHKGFQYLVIETMKLELPPTQPSV